MDPRRPGQRSSGVPPPAGKFSAAQSHLMNDKYMADFEKAWEELHGLNVGQGSSGAGRGGGGNVYEQQRNMYAALEAPSDDYGYGPPVPTAQRRTAGQVVIPPSGRGQRPSAGGGGASGAGAAFGGGQRTSAAGALGGGRPTASPTPGAGRPGFSTSPSRNRISHAGIASGTPSAAPAASRALAGSPSPAQRPFSNSPIPRPSYNGDRPSVGGAGGSWSIPAGSGSESGAGSGAGSGPSRWPGRVNPGWQRGPVDPSGKMSDLSDRPNTCSAADWARGEVVIGSTDHALYVVDASKGVRKRVLYNKASGHTEWVTSVAICPDGRIVSGGMDSKLWLWPVGGTKGVQLEGHFGPISKVHHDPSSDLIISASYDKTIRLWRGGARGHEVGCLQGHEAPVLEMEVGPGGRVVSGDRSGNVLLWDTGAGEAASWRMRGVHQGHVTALAWVAPDDASGQAGCFVSGGQDGCVRVWDPRSKANVAKVSLHVNEKGHGAVGDVIAGGAATAHTVITAGADGTARCLDPRKGYAQSGCAQLTDFPYCMGAAGGLALVGCGDGALHFLDIKGGMRTLYALGANRAAVRCVEACADRLVASGDDGKAMLYHFT